MGTKDFHTPLIKFVIGMRMKINLYTWDEIGLWQSIPNPPLGHPVIVF